MNWEEYVGKKIKVFLLSGKIYTGEILEAEWREGIYFITILDKFNKHVGFLSTEVNGFEECDG